MCSSQAWEKPKKNRAPFSRWPLRQPVSYVGRPWARAIEFAGQLHRQGKGVRLRAREIKREIDEMRHAVRARAIHHRTAAPRELAGPDRARIIGGSSRPQAVGRDGLDAADAPLHQLLLEILGQVGIDVLEGDHDALVRIGVDEPLKLGQQRHRRFFQQDVQIPFQRGEGDFLVQRNRRADNHGVQIPLRQQFMVIQEEARRGEGGNFAEGLENGRRRIGQRRDLHLALLLQGKKALDVDASITARPDQANAKRAHDRSGTPTSYT